MLEQYQSGIYNNIVGLFRQLTPERQLSLIQKLIELNQHYEENKPRHSLLELEGLGKEIWEGIDAQKYVDEERASWGG